MRLLFRQRLFSWFDSYDIYDEVGNTVFIVKGRLSWGHKLEIYDVNDTHIGTVKERVLTFLPKFEMYLNDQYIGEIKKELTILKPVFTLSCNGWTVKGDWPEWDYEVIDSDNRLIMQASKKLLKLTDTYTIDVPDKENVLIALMIVLAIDAAKCSNKS
ncbi:MAG: LURP-one-related/scramblase family protein [Lachnospiraceae bacterium]